MKDSWGGIGYEVMRRDAETLDVVRTSPSWNSLGSPYIVNTGSFSINSYCYFHALLPLEAIPLPVNLACDDAAIGVIEWTRQCCEHVWSMQFVAGSHCKPRICPVADIRANTNGKAVSPWSCRSIVCAERLDAF